VALAQGYTDACGAVPDGLVAAGSLAQKLGQQCAAAPGDLGDLRA
jgi:hypothetical protein